MNTNVVSLRRLLPGAQFVGCDDISVSRITSDSRNVRPGDTFAAIPGLMHDGHHFAGAALQQGAQSVLVQYPISDLAVPQCVVPCSATAFARTSMAVTCGIPSLTTAGITGTNGKTTTTFMLRSILQHSDLKCGLVGTVENSDGQTSQPATMTTPDADVLAQCFRSMMDRSASHCVLEISSHALAQQRCAGIRLSAAAITNITHDHLDYHGSHQSYSSVKASIAELLHADAPLLINMDDDVSRRVRQHLPSSVRTVMVGLNHPDAELKAEILSKTHRSQRVQLHLAQGSAQVRLRLIGEHNVMNCLVAAGLAEQLGVQLDAIVSGLEAVHHVPGRLERIDCGQAFQVLVDYAHTPDALQRCVNTVRAFVPGRLICVFGAGGNRDPSKRPLLARAAESADLMVLTSDNPRFEDPGKIISETAAGFSAGATYLTEPSRRRAIALAMALAEPGDVVLLSGKGHEKTQEIAGRHLPFDDRQVARELLAEATATGLFTDVSPAISLPRSAG